MPLSPGEPKRFLIIDSLVDHKLCYFGVVAALFYPHHTVADADVGLNELGRTRGGFQLFPQGCHKDTERCNVIIPAPAPDVLRDIGMRQHLSGVFRQQTEELVLDWGKLQLLSPQIGTASGLVDG